ncbi:MAG: hypothetical protein O2U61_07315 [Candidatus Bathyarchaeota archaeon]|nr:hypothetical protein [Candidatus Bathyarchaeota archaeon]
MLANGKSNAQESAIKEFDDKNLTEPMGSDNIAYQWAYLALEGTAYDTDRFNPRPTITSRFLGLIFTSMYDAWTRYDDKASPVYLSEVERRPASERTLTNKEIAVSYAAYRALNEYYYSDSTMFRKKNDRSWFGSG